MKAPLTPTELRNRALALKKAGVKHRPDPVGVPRHYGNQPHSKGPDVRDTVQANDVAGPVHRILDIPTISERVWLSDGGWSGKR